jgi:hypothetical protein
VPASFPARFLLVVFGAAVVPLVLIGVWLTRSVVHAGEELLRAELDQSLDEIAIRAGQRWAYWAMRSRSSNCCSTRRKRSRRVAMRA